MKNNKTFLVKALFIEKRLPYRYKKKLELFFIIPNFYIQFFVFSILEFFNRSKQGISIIIPCFNQGNYLTEAVESVINQDYQNIEIIIVNDFSSDKTEYIAEDLIKKYSNYNIILLNNRSNFGLAKSRNIGINKSSNELAYFLDSDDKIHPKTLSTLLKFLKYRNASFVCPGMIKFGDVFQKQWKLRFNKKNQPFINSFIAVGLIKKSAWMESGGFNPNMKYGWEDWDFSLSLIEKNQKIIVAAKPLYYHRRKSESMMSSLWNNEKKKRSMIIQLIRNHPILYKKYSIEELVDKFSYRDINLEVLYAELKNILNQSAIHKNDY